MKKLAWFLSLFFIVFLYAGFLHAGMSSSNYQVTTSVFSGGGAPMSFGNYGMNGTMGQPTPLEPNAPAQSDFSYDLYPGFWYTLDALLSGCLWDIEPVPGDGDVDGSDLAEYAAGVVEDLSGFASEFGKNDCLD